MVEKAIGGGMCQAIYRYVKASSNCMKDYDENKESPYLKYWYVNNLDGWTMSQKFPVNKFTEWLNLIKKFG